MSDTFFTGKQVLDPQISEDEQKFIVNKISDGRFLGASTPQVSFEIWPNFDDLV